MIPPPIGDSRHRTERWSARRRGAALAVFLVLTALFAYHLAVMPKALARQSSVPMASAAAAIAHVREIASRIGPRPAGSASEEAAADYVAAKLAEYGYEARKVSFVRTVGDVSASSVNVVAAMSAAMSAATLEAEAMSAATSEAAAEAMPEATAAGPASGSNLSSDAGAVLICASLDTDLPESKGANDNASGLAAMLECARVLAGSPLSDRVVFAAFGATGMGRSGSKSLVEHPEELPGGLGRIMLAVNLDSVGRGSRVALIPWGGRMALARVDLVDLMRAVGAVQGSHVRFDPTTAVLSEVRADHSPLLAAGIPAVTITTEASLPYAPEAYVPLLGDTIDSIEPASVALASEAAVAALEWAVGRDLLGRPERPYMVLSFLRWIVMIPYTVSIVAASIAVLLGVASVAVARTTLYDDLTRVRGASIPSAMATSLAVFVILAVLLWTLFLPSALVGAWRGLERPWSAYPGAFAIAGVAAGLFFSMLVSRLMGVSIREELRLPMVQISLILQMGLVGFFLAVLRVGSILPALGLLATEIALELPEGFARRFLAWTAPVPMVWLGVRAGMGVGREFLSDILGVPIILCLLVAAAALPYALEILAIVPVQRRQVSSRRSFADLLSDVPAGSIVREYRYGLGAQSSSASSRSTNPHAALVPVGLLAVITTGILFAYPSYIPENPQLVRVTQILGDSGGERIAFESTDNIRNVIMSSGGAAPRQETISTRGPRFSVPFRFNAPSVRLHATMAGTVLRAQLTAGDAMEWAVLEVVGSPDLQVIKCSRSYEVVRSDGEARVRMATAGEAGSVDVEVELSAPEGAGLRVEATGGFLRNPAGIALSGAAKHFYESNRFFLSQPVRAQ
ncbi:MAG: M28 family peptidase [Clostridia bacterium]|nr:M28 family peptidase [Clostridia bacterium]